MIIDINILNPSIFLEIYTFIGYLFGLNGVESQPYISVVVVILSIFITNPVLVPPSKYKSIV